MASYDEATRSGVSSATLTLDKYSAGMVVKQDLTKNLGDDLAIPYNLTSAANDDVYAVLGNKGQSAKTKDTLITRGIIWVQLAAAYATSMNGKGIEGSATAGIAQAATTGGKGKIFGGGTRKILNPVTGVQSTVNIAYVDLG